VKSTTFKASAGSLLLVAGLGLAPVLAATPGQAAPSDATRPTIPLYGASNPGSPTDEIPLSANNPDLGLRNVTYPALIPVLPAPGKANGTAVIVAPGGGFFALSLKNEGFDVAQALANRGVTACVLKYRLRPTPPASADFAAAIAARMKAPPGSPQGGLDLNFPPAVQDALAALKLVRSRAAEWEIDPAKVGMIGFSAGAKAAMDSTLTASSDGDPGTLAPNFIGYIYGPMEKIEVPADAPPMFTAIAFDDPLFKTGDFGLPAAWHAAKRPIEMHVYERGGHGFGLGRPGSTAALLMPEFLSWMEMRGLLPTKP
jgi:acetyl esterase/lipase